MTVSKEQAMAMFDHDLKLFMNDIRGLMSHYRIGDWEPYLFFRKPGCAGSYVLKYEFAAGDEFAKKIVMLHTGTNLSAATTVAPEPRLLTVEALEAVTNYFWSPDSPVLRESEVQTLVESALKEIKANALDDGTLQWAAQWIIDSLRGETNERVIEFAKNMAMTLLAAKAESREVGS